MTCIVCNGTIGRAHRLASLPRPGLVVVPLLTLCAEAVLASEDVCFPLLHLHFGFRLCGPSRHERSNGIRSDGGADGVVVLLVQVLTVGATVRPKPLLWDWTLAKLTISPISTTFSPRTR